MPRGPRVRTAGAAGISRTLSSRDSRELPQCPDQRLPNFSSSSGDAKSSLTDWLDDQANSNASCKSLPFTLIFWFVFVFQQYSHHEVPVSYSLQSNLRDIFTSGLVPVSSRVDDSVTAVVGDAESALNVTSLDRARAATVAVKLETAHSWSNLLTWLDATVVNFLWSVGGGIPGIALEFNRVLGGVRLLQLRLADKECPGAQSLVDLYGYPCSSADKLDTRPIGDPGQQGALVDSESIYTYWLDINHTSDEVKAQVQDLRDRQWLSPATKRALMQVVFYSGEISVFAVVEGVFKLDRGGTMTPKVFVKTLPTTLYDSAVVWIGDVCLVLMLVWLMAGQCATLFLAHRQKRLRATCFNFYSLLNWLLVFMGMAFCCFFAYLSIQLEELGDDVYDTFTHPAPAGPYSTHASAWNLRHGRMDDAFEDMVRLADLRRCAELMTFWYMLLILAKFFESFQANARMATLVETLRSSLSDVCHFLIVFACVFFNFAIGAHFLFGHQLKEWSNMTLALNSGFLALMGDFNYMAMYKIAPVSATVWFWTFMVVAYLVMINMLLAIVMDAYVLVKEKSRSKDTVWGQLSGTLQGSIFKKNSVKSTRTSKSDGESPEGGGWHSEASATTSDGGGSPERGAWPRQERAMPQRMPSQSQSDQTQAFQELINEIRGISARMAALEPAEPSAGAPPAAPVERPASQPLLSPQAPPPVPELVQPPGGGGEGQRVGEVSSPPALAVGVPAPPRPVTPMALQSPNWSAPQPRVP